jgi:hypothetical protein
MSERFRALQSAERRKAIAKLRKGWNGMYFEKAPLKTR